MDALKVAFCDDDAAFRGLLRTAAEEALRANGLAPASVEASSAAELLDRAELASLDLLFLDIDMPGTDGIRLGEALRARGCRADIIYVSNMEEKVYEIFHVHPWSFIRKSRCVEELPAVLAGYAASRRERAGNLILPAATGEPLAVEPALLMYVEATGKCQKLFFTDGTAAQVRSTMRELEALLSPHGFLRIHKGFLVNYRSIRKITSRSVLLDTGRDLPVGRDKLAAARERYLALMRWKGLTKP